MSNSLPSAGLAVGASDSASAGRFGYRPALDGLRGVAILAVVGVNAEWPFLPGGFFGVDVFFVLSGFLITTLLLTEWHRRGAISLKRFLARRALRLMPALVALLVFACAYTVLFRSPEQRGAAFTITLSALLYVSNWVIGLGNVHGTLEHTWSLGVEGQFYLLGASATVFALRRGVCVRQLMWWSVALASVIVVWRAIFWSWTPDVMRIYMGLDTRADSLLVGCAVAFAWAQCSGRKLSNEQGIGLGVLTLMAWMVLLASFVGTPGVSVAYPYRGGFTLVALATGVILFSALTASSGLNLALLTAGPLVWMGRISYSLYLWHVPLKNIFSVDRLLPWCRSSLAAELVRFIIFVVVACGSYFVIERPFLRLKSRFQDGGHISIRTTVAT